MHLAVHGLGYVGSVTAACLAEMGHVVVGVDTDPTKLELVRSGRAPVFEPGLDDRVADAVAAGRLTTASAAAAATAVTQVSIVCVGTPSRSNGGLELRHVEAVTTQIGEALAASDDFHLVVFRSTMLPGTVESHLVPILEGASGKRVDRDFGVAFCPEFLRESSAIADFFDPPFTVAGARDERSASMLLDLFSFLDRPFHVVGIATAEALKYACNAFHATKVVFANEIGRFCHAAGVDGQAVMGLLCEDDRLNIARTYLRPGFAFGGSCLPKDLRALVHEARLLDIDLPMLGSLLPSNVRHVQEAVQQVLDTGARRVTLLGLSFKPGTDDLRESPHIELAETLLGKGIELTICDSHVRPDRLVGANKVFVEDRLPHLRRLLSTDVAEAVRGAECVAVGTNDRELVAAVQADPPASVVDLVGIGDLATVPGYRALAW